MKLSDTANEVIALAEATRNYWDTELPKRHPDYPFVHPGEDDGPPPEENKLNDLLAHLPGDILYKLALLMNLGRGDFGTDDLEEHYQALKETVGKPERVAAQMMAKASLADYLTDGLAELKKSGLDVDRLAFAAVPSLR